MGRRGPPPKPTRLKEIAGNPGKRPLPKGEPRPEPVPGPAAGEPPDWLSGEARQIWFQIAAPMVRCGLATSVDQIALARYCTILARWLRAKALLEEKGDFFNVTAADGRLLGTREAPWSQTFRRLGAQLLQLEREFGLTPAARTRIHVERDRRDGADPAAGAAAAPPAMSAATRFLLGGPIPIRPA